jgi:hypothetical protein
MCTLSLPYKIVNTLSGSGRYCAKLKSDSALFGPFSHKSSTVNSPLYVLCRKYVLSGSNGI